VDWQNALFAPGWGWSALSLVLVVGSLLGLYRQLRLQSAQGAREQLESLDREWTAPKLVRYKLEVLRAYRDAPDHVIQQRGLVVAIALYWERIGSLVHAGHIDARLLHDFNGGACPVWWVVAEPTIRKLRTDYGDPTEYSKFEWLAGVMAALDAKRGASAFDAAMLAEQLAHRIAMYEDELRLAEELKG
jgi:hypothetical protein